MDDPDPLSVSMTAVTMLFPFQHDDIRLGVFQNT